MYGYIHDIPPQQIPHSFFIAIKPNDKRKFSQDRNDVISCTAKRNA